MLESWVLRFIRAVQVEDLLLFGWLVLGEPFLSRLLGVALAGPGRTGANLLPPWNWLVGGFCYAATAGAIICLTTRAAGAQPPLESDGVPEFRTPSGYSRLPMIVVLGILLTTAGELTGLDGGEACFGITLLIWIAAFFLHSRLPEAPVGLRRLLMSPAVIFGTWFYTDTVGDALAGINLTALLAAYGTPEWSMTSFMLTMVTVVTAFSYLMFILAPRQVAGAGGSWMQWIVRFLVYAAGVALNLGPLQIVG